MPERPCHNDLLTANFIDDGRRIRIVDWEYAGMGDVFFDLANFAVNNGLSDDETTTLVRAHFGDVRPEHECALSPMRFMSDFCEAMWGVVQQAVSDLDFDFRGYAGSTSIVSSGPPRSARSGERWVSWSAGGGGTPRQRLHARARRPSPRS